MTTPETVEDQLEFSVVRKELARRAHTERGRERVIALRPSHSAGEVARLLSETQQARRLIEQSGRPSFAGIKDVSQLLLKAARGARLEPPELLSIAACARGLRQLKRHIEAGKSTEYALLLQRTARIDIPLLIEKEITRCLSEEGEVRDSASERLRELRLETHHLTRAVQARVQEIVEDPAYRHMLQEQIVTLRNGRYCVPIKAEFRGEFAGIIHDRSGSGATFFVEPVQIVNLNNQLRELHIDTEEEVDRILKKLSALVASHRERLTIGLEAATELDVALAKGQLSLDWDCALPAINEEGIFDLRRARHPLLGEGAVPIDIGVGEGWMALLITGPNTGGKTVALKTLGLLTLMTRCGLHIPADHTSRVSVAGRVFTDIGDEQSIMQNLSTFSAHLSRLIHVLQEARRGDLVLLDEIGAGTDPEEGAALASAILDELAARGVRTIATSHHSALKAFVHLHPAMQNACVEFDDETARPTFRLRYGQPGSSQALATAERLGMDERIIERAKGYLDPGRRVMDQLIRDLEATRHALEKERDSVREERHLLQQEKEALVEERRKLAIESEKIISELQERGRRLLQEAEEEARQILRTLRTAQKEGKETEKLRRRLKELEEPLANLTASSASPVRHDWDATLKPGDDVQVKNMHRSAILLSLPDEAGMVWVRAGNVKLQVKAEEVKRLPKPSPTATAGGATALRLDRALRTPPEIDLHGMHLQEALEKLDRYLDDAVLSDLESVRIIHGVGTGALREAIRNFLTNHPAISSYRPAEMDEGGAGATIAFLRQ